MDFFGRKNRRHLLETSHALGCQALEDFLLQSRRGIHTLRFAIRVVRIGGKTEAKSGGVAFAPAGIKLHQAGGPAQKQHQHSGGERVERADVADLAETG